jgi:hypothetical protein
VTNRQAYGLRTDDCLLVSVGRGGAASAWLANGDNDVFVPWADVVAVWAD